MRNGNRCNFVVYKSELGKDRGWNTSEKKIFIYSSNVVHDSSMLLCE